MIDLDGAGLAEILALVDKALGPGLSEEERVRWRALTSKVLELLGNISPSGSQRRRHLRAAAALTVEVLAPAPRRGLVTSSIGGGGLALQLAEPPKEGTLLQLALRVPDREEPIPAEAVVVWLRPGPVTEVGATFTSIDPRDQDLLEALVLRRLTQQ
jgi:hypothetical protein